MYLNILKIITVPIKLDVDEKTSNLNIESVSCI